jgi:hypothetical protein
MVVAVRVEAGQGRQGPHVGLERLVAGHEVRPRVDLEVVAPGRLVVLLVALAVRLVVGLLEEGPTLVAPMVALGEDLQVEGQPLVGRQAGRAEELHQLEVPQEAP